ncbi:Cyclin-dependent kinase inhibitor 3-like protein [Drosera capensis]
MGRCVKKRRGSAADGAVVGAAEIGVRITRSRAVAMAAAVGGRSSARRIERKVGGGELRRSVELRRGLRGVIQANSSSSAGSCVDAEENCPSGVSDDGLPEAVAASSCCSSNSSTGGEENKQEADCDEDVLKTADPEEVEECGAGRENSMDFDLRQRREKTPSRESQPQADDAMNSRNRSSIGSKMPSDLEIEEFFAEAEKDLQKRFIDKYNFDIVRDVPLEGRYQWVPVKP